jgi:opacity protein-like surface antigen
VTRALIAGLLLTAVAAPAAAQSVGLGARTTSVRSEADPEGADAERLNGGVARIALSRRTALEVALDYRTTTDNARRERVREFPLQASLLLYPIRTPLSVYLLGGAGWYNNRFETLDAGGAVLDTVTDRRMGTHAGLGAELMLSRRLSVYGDYRYTFLRFGEPDDGTPTAAGALPLPGTIGLQEQFKLRHEASMWTFGVTVNF